MKKSIYLNFCFLIYFEYLSENVKEWSKLDSDWESAYYFLKKIITSFIRGKQCNYLYIHFLNTLINDGML